MPRLSFDLGDLWKDFKGIAKDAYTLWTVPKEAPPTIRTPDAAFISLLNKQNRSVGVFVPELYELAKVNGLIAQQKERQWLKENKKAQNKKALVKQQPFYNELYTEAGHRKSAFELAVLPVNYSDHHKKSARAIQKRVEDEFNNRIDKGQPLPPVVFKFQIESDYLKNIHLLNLHASGPRAIKLNLLNPGDKTPKYERAAHYLAQRTALLLTLFTALAVTASSPLTFFAAAIGVTLAEWCAKEFSFYDLAETLLRDIKSIFSKDFFWGEKISLKKTLKTGILLAALGLGALEVAALSFSFVAGLPVWAMMASTLGAKVLAGLQYSTAGFLSFVAGTGVIMGGSVAQRFFWGLGIWDKQIDFSKEKAPAAIKPKALLDHKIAKLQRYLDNEQKALPKHSHKHNDFNKAKVSLTNLRVIFDEKSKHVEPKHDYMHTTRKRAVV